MRHISNLHELKKAIQDLEVQQQCELEILNNEFKKMVNEFTPYNFLKWTMADFATKLSSNGKLTGLVMGISAGYLAKVFNITNILMELEISTLVTKNADKIIAYIKKAFNLFQKK
jgi:hypothetical protein